jgi:hypothetical protein
MNKLKKAISTPLFSAKKSPLWAATPFERF